MRNIGATWATHQRHGNWCDRLPEFLRKACAKQRCRLDLADVIGLNSAVQPADWTAASSEIRMKLDADAMIYDGGM